jgi:hypothetical protein
MNRLETTWPGERTALMQACFEEHEKRCAEELEAFQEQHAERLRAFRVRENELHELLKALGDERRAFCDAQDDALISLHTRQDKQRARVAQEWGVSTAISAVAELELALTSAAHFALVAGGGGTDNYVVLPSSQPSPHPPPLAVVKPTIPQPAEEKNESSSSLSPSSSTPILSVGLAYECEGGGGDDAGKKRKKKNQKRSRRPQTYLDAFPNAERVDDEEQEEDSVVLFDEEEEEEDAGHPERDCDEWFVNDEHEKSNYEHDEEEEEEEEENEEEDIDDDDSQGLQAMDVDDDIEDDDDDDDSSSSSFSLQQQPPPPSGKSSRSRYVPLVMEATRKQPRRQARENAQPVLRRMFADDINGLIGTLGHNKPKTKQNFVYIEKALSSGASMGEWDAFDVRVPHDCDFCVKKATCGVSFSIGARKFHCGTTCVWVVRPVIELLVHVHTAPPTRDAENTARDMVSHAQECVKKKARHWKKRRGDPSDEEDEEDDKGIDITKKK